jgi:hypothetical protein
VDQSFEELIARVGLPPDFRRAKKEDLVPEAVVYLWAEQDDRPIAYGPHTVVGPSRVLGLTTFANKNGIHYDERLARMLIKD